MQDDPDARLQAAEPSSQPVAEAPEMRRPDGKAPFHEAIDPDLVDDLQLAIGKGLALVVATDSSEPDAVIEALADYLDAVGAGTRRFPSDRADGALGLGCLLGQALCRKLGWGFAHVRRTRRPGILVISPDRCYAAAPRAVIERALDEGRGAVVREYVARLQTPKNLPASSPGRYLRIA